MSTVPNLRDLGGTLTSDGRAVRPGVLLRSGAPLPGDGPPDGVAWPPAQVLDLRSSAETGAVHPLTETGAAVRQISLLEALRPGGEQAVDPAAVERMRTGGLEELYLGMLEVAAHRLVEVAALVADTAGPTLVHCAAGKDRTGVVVALVLSAVGVPRDAVVADYLASRQAMDDIVRRLGEAVDPAYAPPSAYLALPQGAIEAVLDTWEEHEGGLRGWLATAGAATDLVPRLERRLLG